MVGFTSDKLVKTEVEACMKRMVNRIMMTRAPKHAMRRVVTRQHKLTNKT